MVLREYFVLLHLPTTSCLIALAVIGASLASTIYLERLAWVVLIVFLGGCVGANFMDEICGRPWRTKIPELHLWTVGLVGFFASVVGGLYLALTVDIWFIVFVMVWAFFIPAYNLELFGGRFHNAQSIGVSWGLVCLGSLYLQNLTITLPAVAVSLAAGVCSMYGIVSYEKAKPFCKDRKPFAPLESQLKWESLKKQIILLDAITIAFFMQRLLTSFLIQ